jgi:hypothetical protein
LLSDWELWAVADATLKSHGAEAPLFVATRIGALALANDADGVTAWLEIARRMTKLSAVPPPDIAC